MQKPENGALGAEALAELHALDAALSGEAVDERHEELAALAVALRTTRPRPREQFLATLDEQAAPRFSPRARRVSAWRRPAHGRLHDVVRHPAFAIAALAVLAVAIILPLALLGKVSVHSTSSHSAAAPQAERVRGLPSGATPEAHQNGAETPRHAAAAAGAEARPPGAPAAGTRQVEHTASLDVGVAPSAIQSASQRVFTLASAFHGYVQQSNVSSGSAEGGGASFSLRVPSSNLGGAIAALAHIGHVRSENETTNDVTEAHAALERSLADARAERASLLAALSRSSEVEHSEALKAKLRVLEARIAQLEGSLRALNSRISYTNIALSLTPEAQSGAGAGELTPGGALHDAGAILDVAIAVAVLAAAVLVPVAAIAALLGLGMALTRRRLREHALDAS
jgi:hypothetical protein